MWGVLPVKNFENAKTRLAPALSPEERRALFRLMVEDVLAAMVSSSLAGVLVLTNEPEVSDLAGRYGARAVGEPENLGQSQAVARAMRILESEDVRAAVQLPGDIHRPGHRYAGRPHQAAGSPRPRVEGSGLGAQPRLGPAA